MNALFNFDTFITPKVITVIYWLSLLMVVISGIAMMFSGNGAAGFFGGLLLMVFGALFVRVYCEMIMVFFKNNMHLKEISLKDKL